MNTKIKLFLALSICFSQFIMAQTPIQNPKQIFSLSIESNEGNNGLAVAFDENKNIYYSVFAGNASYPIEVHNASGKSISSSAIGADLRAFWYDNDGKKLEGILYDNQGICHFKLNQSGFPTGIDINTFSYGMEGNDVACFHKGKVYFVSSGGIKVFKAGKNKGKLIKNSQIFSEYEIYNQRSLFHTGIKGYELGIYDFQESKVVFMNEKTGMLVAEITIPLEGYYEGLDNFNVSFANQHLFLYNKESRSWNAFKIF